MTGRSSKSSEIEDKVISAVSGADSNGAGNGTIRLSTGVILTAKKISGFLMQEVVRQFPKPKPPMWHNEEMGREEPNPDNPKYVEELSEREANIGLAMIDLFIIAGSEYKSHPRSIPGPDDSSWVDDLQAIGMEVGENKKKKYLMWIKYIAAPDEADMSLIIYEVGKKSGVSEEAVASAADTFRSKARRRTNRKS
jgi:hypothetical protein